MSSEDPWAPEGADEAPTSQRAGAAAGRPATRDPLFLTAVALFFLGLIFTIAAAVAPALLGHEGPTWVYLCAMFALPIGFLLALAYAIRSGRRPRA